MNNAIKILYVDDEEMNLFIFRELFKSQYQVTTCSSPLEGLRILESEGEINVIISDMSMPVMNGLEFIEKAKERFPEKSYYILTAYEMNDEIEKSISSQKVKKCFQKPINMKEISVEISNTPPTS